VKQKTTWKTMERAIAKRLNGTRSGPTGRDSADVVTEHYSIECKLRDALPEWLKRAMIQSHVNAEPDTLPVLILHECGGRRDNDIVCMSLETFTKLRVDDRDPAGCVEMVRDALKAAR